MELSRMNDGERERLYLSGNCADLEKFYRSFSGAAELIEWMKGRPSAPIRIVERVPQGAFSDDIVVVIPTSDAEGPLSRNCSDTVFSGMRIIFVESSGPLFNVERSVNAGVSHALRYNPRWIVLSADDVQMVDGPEKLASELAAVDHEKFDTVYMEPPGVYHSFPGMLGEEGYLMQLIRSALQFRNLDSFRVMRRLGSHSWIHLPDFHWIFGNGNSGQVEGRQPRLLPFLLKVYSPFVRGKISVIQMRSIGILSARFARERGGEVADGTFINSSGDIDLSIRVARRGRIAFINYRIRCVVGASLGDGRLRKMKDIAGEIYLDYKLKNGLI